MAVNPYVNKIEKGDEIIIDLSGDTVTPQTLLEGETAHDGSGAPIVGAVRMSLPPGIIFPYGGSTPPSGYLLCDGSDVSRTDYAALFAVIGTTYGAGDGSDTFNLPNLQGRVPVGSSTDYTMGSSGGEKEHTLTSAESGSPAHSHGLNSHKHTVGAHSHGLNSHKHTVPQHGHGNNISFSVNSSGYAQNGISGGSHIHGFSGWAARPAWYSGDQSDWEISYSAGANNGSLVESNRSAHNHDLPSHTHTLTKTGGVSDKAAFDTGAASGNTDNSAAFDTGAASGNTADSTATNASSAHNNMQPYQIVNYIISV